MIMALAIALSAGSVRAQDSRIAQVLELFTATCAKFADRPSELRSYLTQNYKRLPQSEEKEILGNPPGQGWQSNNVIFASYDNGECAVMIDTIAIDPMRASFRKWVLDLGRANLLTVQLMSDLVERGDYEARYLSFIAAKPDAKRGVQYMLTTIQEKDKTYVRLSTIIAATTQ